MNQLEYKMLNILQQGKDNFGYEGVKAEFEAEGTRMEEMLRLIDITRRAGLNLGLKIGGCEAVRDLIDCKQIGADYIIAPMIESPYALSKFIQIKDKYYTDYERNQTQFLFNIETCNALNALESILKIITPMNSINGIVFGRVDFTGSCLLPRDNINNEIITDKCITVANACKQHGLLFVVGGGITQASLSALYKIQENFLSRFETRKIIFNAKALTETNIKEGLMNAVEFELCWLLNKREYYSYIAAEDLKRIEMLQTRLTQSKNSFKFPSQQSALV